MSGKRIWLLALLAGLGLACGNDDDDAVMANDDDMAVVNDDDTALTNDDDTEPVPDDDDSEIDLSCITGYFDAGLEPPLEDCLDGTKPPCELLMQCMADEPPETFSEIVKMQSPVSLYIDQMQCRCENGDIPFCERTDFQWAGLYQLLGCPPLPEPCDEAVYAAFRDEIWQAISLRAACWDRLLFSDQLCLVEHGCAPDEEEACREQEPLMGEDPFCREVIWSEPATNRLLSGYFADLTARIDAFIAQEGLEGCIHLGSDIPFWFCL